MLNDEILTVKETAVLLKTTRQQVRKMIANDESVDCKLDVIVCQKETPCQKAGSSFDGLEVNRHVLFSVNAADFISAVSVEVYGIRISCPQWITLIAISSKRISIGAENIFGTNQSTDRKIARTRCRNGCTVECRFLAIPEIEIIFPCTGSIESDFAEVVTLISIHIPECCVRIAGHTPNGVVKYSDAVYAALKI